ncbi:hypothetical protein [Tenacibaculum jejuense]|uniref:Lipocalin-like domain-containing protein n=1 Tax=Tenacibaculum jejuense TaxID=584609 RepID=A0A238U6G5_9FLAO|nr:hypothetical protein [Tenacibaculum jejuense]SNR14747.1 conserved exported protein of unknown function [Tenacibaculum jejuense]
MKIKIKLPVLFLLFCTTLFGQKNELTEKNIVGKWNFTKTIDKHNQEVKYVYRTYPNGEKMKIVASGPDITLNSDGTYLKKFTKENTDSGNWKIISESEIEYQMVIPKDSRQGKLIIQTEKFMPNKKWRKDENGNFLDASSDKIIELTLTEMKIEYEKDYILIYKKVIE